MRLPRGLSKLFTGNEALNQPVIIIVTDISFFIFVLIFFSGGGRWSHDFSENRHSQVDFSMCEPKLLKCRN